MKTSLLFVIVGVLLCNACKGDFVIRRGDGALSETKMESGAVSATESISSVTDLNANGEVGQISLSWGAVPTAAKYKVLRSASADPKNSVIYAEVAALTYIDDQVEDDVPYYYRVVAVTASGLESDSSPTVHATSSPATSPARFLSAKTAENSRVSLEWYAPTSTLPVTAYRIYRSTATPVEITSANLLTTVPATTLAYADLSVANGTSYYYRVVADTTKGAADPSTEADAKPWNPAAAADMNNVFVDFGGGAGVGSFASPYNSLATAYAAVNAGGTINIFDSTWNAGVTFIVSKSFTIRSLTGDFRNSAVVFDGRGINIAASGTSLNETIRILGIEFANWNDNLFNNGNRDVKNFEFKGNYFHDGTSHAIYSYRNSSGTFNCRWLIQNNRFENLNTAFRSAIVTSMKPNADVEISFNEFNSVHWNAIQIAGVGGYVIQYNTVNGTTDNGIQLDGALSNITIRSNSVVQANTSATADLGCLTVWDAAGVTGPVTIANNNFENCINGISFRNAALTTANHFSIVRNSFRSNSGKGIFKAGSGNLDAVKNYWGSETGPKHSSNPSGQGDRVDDGVTFLPFRTAP